MKKGFPGTKRYILDVCKIVNIKVIKVQQKIEIDIHKLWKWNSFWSRQATE